MVAYRLTGMKRIAIGLVLLLVSASVHAADSIARPASPGSLAKVSDQVHALFRSAKILFAVSFDRPPVHASTDSAGVTLVLGGDEPGRIVRLNSLGELQWQHDVTRRFSETGPYPPEFTPADDGTIMLVYAVPFGAEAFYPRDPPQGEDSGMQDGEGEAVRYLVIKPDGSIAIDDTLGIEKDLSPDGKYYYSIFQEGNELVLKRTSGNKWRIGIPPPEHQDAPERPDLTVGFVGTSRVMVSERTPSGRRTGLIDLLSQGALWTELEFPSIARPACFERLQAGIGHGGELIYADSPDSALDHSQVFGFDPDGKLLWARKLTGDWVTSYPRWVICAADQELAAVFTQGGFGIIDPSTGRILDARAIDVDLTWALEGSFEGGRLYMAGQTWRGNRPSFLQATVGHDGKITSLAEHEVVMRGLAPKVMSCIVSPGDSTQPWVVTGFKR